MNVLKTALTATLPALFLIGCTTTTTVEKPTNLEVKTVTSVNGVEVKGVAYHCQGAQSDSELTNKLTKDFLVEYSDAESAILVDKTGSYPLTRVRTGSGSKYESADGQQMVWDKGEQATITFDKVTFNNCKVKK